MCDDSLNLMPYIPHDQYIVWQPLTPEMNVVSRMDADSLSRIVAGVDNDEDMWDFCRLTGSWHCYVMTDCTSGSPMAFCVIEVVEPGRSILFHGGRIPDYGNILLFYRGTALMLKTLLDRRYSVGTTTKYARSQRFMSALGFVADSVDNGIVHMQLTPESFENSMIYKRMKQDNLEFHRETELKKQLIDIQKEFADNRQLLADNIDINVLLRLKNVLGGVNNLITLLATCGFVDYLKKRDFITGAQANGMKNIIQSQHMNANGYDIDCIVDGFIPVIAEVKCNIPVKGVEFGSAQRNGILNDVMGLLFGKKRAKPKDAYKFMVILNTDKCSAEVNTRSAIDKLLLKINSKYANVMVMPDDNSLLRLNNVYVVVLDL